MVIECISQTKNIPTIFPSKKYPNKIQKINKKKLQIRYLNKIIISNYNDNLFNQLIDE